MNLEMAEADPSKEEKDEKSAGQRGESPMEVTEALTHLPTLSTAMQLARPFQPDDDVKFVPYIARELEYKLPKLTQYAPED